MAPRTPLSQQMLVRGTAAFPPPKLGADGTPSTNKSDRDGKYKQRRLPEPGQRNLPRSFPRDCVCGRGGERTDTDTLEGGALRYSPPRPEIPGSGLVVAAGPGEPPREEAALTTGGGGDLRWRGAAPGRAFCLRGGRNFLNFIPPPSFSSSSSSSSQRFLLGRLEATLPRCFPQPDAPLPGPAGTGKENGGRERGRSQRLGGE
ncbi:uncharacterized protein ACIBXB_013115 [Morphnus guianensis]